MDLLMLKECRAADEAFLALRARKWFLTRVDPPVDDKVRFASKAFTTLLTMVRLEAQVNLLMFSASHCGPETLPTGRTGIWALHRVDLFVFPEI